MNKQLTAIAVSTALGLSAVPVAAQEQAEQSAAKQVTAEQVQALLEQVQALQDRVEDLESKLAKQQQADAPEQPERQIAQADGTERKRISNQSALAARVERLEEDVEDAQNAPIRIGGAVRTQFVWEDYNEGGRDRGGDFDFDLLRLDYSGSIGDVILSAQYRWFQYMNVVQHAWVGYNFTDNWQGQVGVTKVPFGNMPYNSNSYFFSSNFYVGLEDDHDLGAKMRYRSDDWDLDFAFFKNDEQGGVDGFVSNREDRYAYDPLGVRLTGEGAYDTPTLAVGESNSWAVRAARKFDLSDDSSAELGVSGQFGGMNDGVDNVGDRSALALHGIYNVDRWTFMGQISQYQYDMDMMNEGIVVGAYAFYDTIPAEATLYTANIAYSLPVEIGPISNLTFYNDYSLMTDKEGFTEDTFMNVLGMAVTAGGLYTYFDIVTAKNHPFIGGTMAGEAEDTNTRFNINIGYYF